MSATVQYYIERSFRAFFPFFITTDMSAIATGDGYRTEHTSSALGAIDVRARAHCFSIAMRLPTKVMIYTNRDQQRSRMRSLKGAYQTSADIYDILRYQEDQRIHLTSNGDSKFS